MSAQRLFCLSWSVLEATWDLNVVVRCRLQHGTIRRGADYHLQYTLKPELKPCHGHV